MKSTHTCPACSLPLDLVPYNGAIRLFCGSVNCADETCREGVLFEPKWGEDTNDAYAALQARYNRLKGAAK